MKANFTQRLFLASIAACAVGVFATRALAATDDATFVNTFAQANQSEVSEGQYVLKMSKDPKTRAYAQMMISDHSTSNVKLVSAARGANVPAPKLAMAAGDTAPAMLAGLSGKPLSTAYFKGAVSDHEKALDMLKDEAANGQSPALRKYASDTEPVVQHHLDIASQWTQSGGRLPEMIAPVNTPATGNPMAGNPAVEPNGPLQSAAPTVQTSATANPQPTGTTLIGTPPPTATPGPP